MPELEEILETPRKSVLRKRISALSFAKKKLEKKIKTLTQCNKRLKKKIASVAVILKDLKTKNYISKEQFLKLNLKSEVIDLINRIYMKKNSQKSYRAKYPPALRKFALTLNFYSSAAYKYVRSVFDTALPHPRVLSKWYENTASSPGFTQPAFDILKKKSTLSGKRLLCTFVADEMALRHQTLWTGKKTDGLVDFGIDTEYSPEIATQVYVFILVGLNESWKMPVGYFFVKSLSKETRANLINICIGKCYDSGADVVAVTFDGCPSNLAAANLLGCDLSTPNNLKTTFLHPECGIEVAVILDPCHMIKLVRNTFEAKKVIFANNNKEIRWNLIVALNQLQSSQGLNFANRLSKRHINFRNEIMKVKLATQLLSRSISRALELCDQLIVSSKIKNTEPTAEFISIFNDLFDVFNSRSSGKYDFKKPISPSNATEILDFLEKAKNYILSLRIYSKIKRTIRDRIIINISKKSIVECKSKTGFLGFLICIESLKHLFINYVISATPALRYIATYRLSQDHIENFFGVIRRQGGYNNNPNTIQFKALYKRILSHLELRSSFSGNCIPLEHIPILTCSSSGILNINSTSGLRAIEADEKKTDIFTPSDKSTENNVTILAEILNNENCSESIKQITGYISGWIARKLVKTIKCEICVDALYTNQKLWFHKLVTIRDMGGLCYASENLFTVCLKAELVIKSHLNDEGVHFASIEDIEKLKCRILKTFINCNVFDSLIEHSKHQTPMFNHRVHLIKTIIDKYTNVRLHSAHKNNPEIQKLSKRQKRNKLNLFEGI